MGIFLKIAVAAVAAGAGAVVGIELGAQALCGMKSAADWVQRKMRKES